MVKTAKTRSGWNDRRVIDSFISIFLSVLLVFGGLPTEALAETADALSGNDEVTLEEAPAEAAEALELDVTEDAPEGQADDLTDIGATDAEEPGEALPDPEADLAIGDEEQAAAEVQSTDDALTETDANADTADVEDIAEPELTAQAEYSYTVIFEANGGGGTIDNQVISCDEETALVNNAFTRDGYVFSGWNTEADGSGTAYVDGQLVKDLANAADTITLYAQWVEVPEEVELTAQASATTQTIKTSGFIVTLPKAWSGKVTSSTSTLSGQNVGTLTNIYMTDGGGLVTIHCAKRSQFKRVTGWGDVCLIGRKTGTDYIVEVYMMCWPWMDFELDSNGLNNMSATEMARASATLSMLTGGAYSRCGGSKSTSYSESFSAAKLYVKKNILNNITLRGTNRWVQSGSRWWYSLADGTYPKSTFRTISGATYYFDASGWMVTGWRKISGAWYYFHPNGKMARSAWIKSGSSWYRMGKNGKMLTGLRTVGNQRYYFEKSGAMATGWKQISKKWYYFGSSGAMVRSAWVGNYYLQADGTMATNKWIGKYHVNDKGRWDMTRQS